MKKQIILFSMGIIILLSFVSAYQTILIDDFNRVDNGDVGNGWVNKNDSTSDVWMIANNTLQVNVSSSYYYSYLIKYLNQSYVPINITYDIHVINKMYGGNSFFRVIFLGNGATTQCFGATMYSSAHPLAILAYHYFSYTNGDTLRWTQRPDFTGLVTNNDINSVWYQTNNFIANCSSIDAVTIESWWNNDQQGIYQLDNLSMVVGDPVLGNYSIYLTEPTQAQSFCYGDNIFTNFTVSFSSNSLDKCWYQLDSNTNISTTCNSPFYLNTTSGSHNLIIYANTTDGFTVSNSTTFSSVNKVLTTTITNPTEGQNITKTAITDTFNLAGVINSTCSLDKIWYIHYNSTGGPTAPVYINYTDTPTLSVDYFGTHNLLLFANNTLGDLDNDGVTFNIIQQVGGGGGGGAPKETQVPIPFYVREKTFDQTCGFDGDQDGLKCDPNEDWISCPDDCEFPSLDKMLCIGGAACVWREAWFLKMLFLMLMLITIYLVYTDLTAGARRRKIFR